jgi:hypothetical protein
MRTATEFARNAPEATYEELARGLSPDIAPVQLEAVLQEEAVVSGDILGFLKDGLSRNLREYLPEGWKIGPDAEFQASKAYAMWVGALGEEYEALGRSAWRRLRALQPPAGWLPTLSDPLLEAAFEDMK